MVAGATSYSGALQPVAIGLRASPMLIPTPPRDSCPSASYSDEIAAAAVDCDCGVELSRVDSDLPVGSMNALWRA